MQGSVFMDQLDNFVVCEVWEMKEWLVGFFNVEGCDMFGNCVVVEKQVCGVFLGNGEMGCE